MNEEIHLETNGTFTVDLNMPEAVRIIRNIPTRGLAEEIVAALWEIYQSGMRDAA